MYLLFRKLTNGEQFYNLRGGQVVSVAGKSTNVNAKNITQCNKITNKVEF